MFLQSNFYPTLLYIVFVFFLAFLTVFFLSLVSFYFQITKIIIIKKNIHSFCFLASSSGGILCALRIMLTSVVGVGIHWLEPIMRMLHVQCMAKIFDCGSFGYST